MSTRYFLSGTVALSILAALAGLVVIGGPSEARRQTFDKHRYRELATLGDALVCKDAFATPALPVELTAESLRGYCGGRGILPSDLEDDETGKPYAYTRKSDDEYTICASFYDAARAERLTYHSSQSGWSFDPATGCVAARFQRASG